MTSTSSSTCCSAIAVRQRTRSLPPSFTGIKTEIIADSLARRGKSVVFVMHLPLSPHFRPGTRKLVWALENEVGVRQARATGDLRIDG